MLERPIGFEPTGLPRFARGAGRRTDTCCQGGLEQTPLRIACATLRRCYPPPNVVSGLLRARGPSQRMNDGVERPIGFEPTTFSLGS